jgi:hypothetical protein
VTSGDPFFNPINAAKPFSGALGEFTALHETPWLVLGQGREGKLEKKGWEGNGRRKWK